MIFYESLQPDAYNKLQARNLARQIEFIKDATLLSNTYLPGERLTGNFIRQVHAITMAGLMENPGQYRDDACYIEGSNHVPPSPAEISNLVGDLCVDVNEFWDDADPFDLSAYVLWRLTWIHPFANGNGRIADAIAYFVLCRKHETWFSGAQIIPTYWRDNKDRRYYEALQAADNFGADNFRAVKDLSDLIQAALFNQLDKFYRSK